jgi:predicted dehydrogenase
LIFCTPSLGVPAGHATAVFQREERGQGGMTSPGAGNVWSIMSVDAKHNLVYASTTSNSPDFFGGARLAKVPYSTSVVALNANTGKPVWHFQLVHHNIFDYDAPSQPTLTALSASYRLDLINISCDYAGMKKCKCAVIGVGYLGKFHAEKYAALANVELVAVVDSNLVRAEEIAQALNCVAYKDYASLIGKVDAVSIVTPTKTHYQVAKFFLENGVHTLIEKPITSTVAEADELIELAKQHQVLIQVGHLERFNPAVIALHNVLKQPKFIESHRIAPFTLRGADVNVVLDLMIHDIDLLTHLVGSEVKSVLATGAPVLSNEIDIANARIEFANGAVANVTASRAGMKKERMMRIFQEDAYLSVNLQDKSCSIYRKGEGEMFPGIPDIKMESLEFPQGDAIKEEISAFVDSILHNKPSVVPGEDGKKALAIAAKITAAVGA